MKLRQKADNERFTSLLLLGYLEQSHVLYARLDITETKLSHLNAFLALLVSITLHIFFCSSP